MKAEMKTPGGSQRKGERKKLRKKGQSGTEMSMPERSRSVEQELIVIYICLMIKTARCSFQLHFLALFGRELWVW